MEGRTLYIKAYVYRGRERCFCYVIKQLFSLSLLCVLKLIVVPVVVNRGWWWWCGVSGDGGGWQWCWWRWWWSFPSSSTSGFDIFRLHHGLSSPPLPHVRFLSSPPLHAISFPPHHLPRFCNYLLSSPITICCSVPSSSLITRVCLTVFLFSNTIVTSSHFLRHISTPFHNLLFPFPSL